MRRHAFLVLFCLASLALVCADRWGDARMKMIREIEHEVQLTSREIGKDRFDERVMAAMASVPRHEFVPLVARRFAYDNRPLPIGHGQTISQPYIVALMTDLVDADPNDVILEVGTGSGYQAAVLSSLAKEVWTIEIVPELATSAAERLQRLGYDNVHVREGDGYLGWPEHAPFDGILVTAASPDVPPALVEQLAPGGRMIMPLGGEFSVQHLVLITKAKDGTVRTKKVLPVRFVPLTGEH